VKPNEVSGEYELVFDAFHRPIYSFACPSGFNKDSTSLKFGSIVVELKEPNEKVFKSMMKKLKTLSLQSFRFEPKSATDEPVVGDDQLKDLFEGTPSQNTENSQLAIVEGLPIVSVNISESSQLKEETSLALSPLPIQSVTGSEIQLEETKASTLETPVKVAPSPERQTPIISNPSPGTADGKRKIKKPKTDADRANNPMMSHLEFREHRPTKLLPTPMEDESKAPDCLFDADAGPRILPHKKTGLTVVEVTDSQETNGPTVQMEPDNLSECRGIVNVDNTCFMNAALQALFACRFVRDDLTWMVSNIIPRNEGWPSTWYSVAHGRNYPDQLRKHVQLQLLMKAGEHHDPAEFIEKLFEHIQDELVSRSLWQRIQDYTYRPIVGHFKFTLASIAKCKKCRKDRYQGIDTHSALIIPLGRDTQKQYIQHLIGNYLNDDVINLRCGLNNCDCSVMRRKLMFETLPLYLRIQLKRVRVVLNGLVKSVKNVRPVIPDEEIQLQSNVINNHWNWTFVDPETMQTAKSHVACYKLISVVYHLGKEVNTGHYITIARKRFREPWKRYDDQNCFDVDEKVLKSDNLLTQSSSILIYQRKP
jgi:ubiquitin C-terminal hydrolase